MQKPAADACRGRLSRSLRSERTDIAEEFGRERSKSENRSTGIDEGLVPRALLKGLSSKIQGFGVALALTLTRLQRLLMGGA